MSTIPRSNVRPHDLLEIGLRPRSVVLWWFLGTTGKLDEKLLPPRKQIAARFGWSQSSVQRALRELRANGLVPGARP